MEFKVTHSDGGFFSCSTVALLEIVQEANRSGLMPSVDRTRQYGLYKSSLGQNLIPYYFLERQREHPGKRIALPDCMAVQWMDYRKLPFKSLRPFIESYFMPSIGVSSKIVSLISCYKIELENTVAVFYRGNDKERETETPTYRNFLEQCRAIKDRRPEVKFLVQPDEGQFLDEFMGEFPDSIYFKETPMIPKTKTSSVFHTIDKSKRADYGAWFFAAVSVIALCSELVTHSGNGGLWAALYRGTPKGIHQIYKNQWFV